MPSPYRHGDLDTEFGERGPGTIGSDGRHAQVHDIGVDGRRLMPRSSAETAAALLAVMRRRWPLVLACMLLGTTAGILAATHMRPRYVATASVVVTASTPRVLDEVRGVNDWDADVLAYSQFNATQRAIMGSRKIGLRVLDELGLTDDWQFLGLERISDPQERVRRAAGIDRLQQLAKYLAIRAVPNSHVVETTVRYPDAETARDLANHIVDTYIDHVSRSKDDTGAKAKIDLAAERDAARERLRLAERELDAFKQSHEITSISLADRQNLITQNIVGLSERTNSAHAHRIELETLWEQATILREREGLVAAVSVLPPDERELIDALLTERLEAEREFNTTQVDYLEKHPNHQRAKIRAELAGSRLEEACRNLLNSLRARLQAARDSESRLAAALEVHRQRALELSRLEPRFRELAREVQSANDTFTLLQRRDAEIEVSNRVEHNPIRVLDRARTPARPDQLLRYLAALAGLLAGLAMGILSALFVDGRDHRIRGRHDLERAVSGLALPVLGELPQLPADPQLGAANMRAQRRQRDLHAYLFPQSMMAERCRSVRAAVSFALPREGSVAILVTSPGSAEGKSSTAMNLALSYCQAQKSVLLVDADMRRPRLHQVFPPPLGREHLGLSSVIAGLCQLDDALLSDLHQAPERLTVLPCGELPEHPAELLESTPARRLFNQLRERFDVIIIDSPPLLPVVDPLILSPLADGVVLVARSDATTREELAIALDHLRRRDTYVVGIVLNEVEGRARRNGYGSAYYTYAARGTDSSASGAVHPVPALEVSAAGPTDTDTRSEQKSAE